MTFSTNMKATGLSLLTKYGQLINWSRANAGEYNAITGDITIASTTNYQGYGYPSAYTSFQIDGTIIQQGDILLILSATTAPINEDVFNVNSKNYTVLNVTNISAQGNNVIYKVQLRQ